jgi:hypothetical protein
VCFIYFPPGYLVADAGDPERAGDPETAGDPGPDSPRAGDAADGDDGGQLHGSAS